MERSLPTHTLSIVCDTGTDAHHALTRIRTLLEECTATAHSLTLDQGTITAGIIVDVRGSIRVARALDASPFISFFTTTELRPPIDAVSADT